MVFVKKISFWSAEDYKKKYFSKFTLEKCPHSVPQTNFKKIGYIESLWEWLYILFWNHEFRYKTKHPFHIVEPSPWPAVVSFFLYVNLLYTMCGCEKREDYAIWGFAFGLIFAVFIWLVDVYREEIAGFHTLKVQAGFRLGILLFILSEVMLFVSFFWAFFHFSLNPPVDVGLAWPMEGLPCFLWYKIPLINTLLLICSGIDVTIAHETVLRSNKEEVGRFWERFEGLKFIYPIPYRYKIKFFFTVELNAIRVLLVENWNDVRVKLNAPRFLLSTLVRGLIFLACQYIEYLYSPFSACDCIYGSVFFMATGLHGFHVFIGFSALLYCGLIRYRLNKIGMRFWQHIVGFEGSIWYWHFVDVVWLFLFLAMYWWSSV